MSGIHVTCDLDALRSLGKQIQQAANDARHDLAEMGRAEAQAGYDTSIHTGSSAIAVFLVTSANQTDVVATGEQVVFTEFGTGVAFPEHPLADKFGFHHGTYGKGHGNNYNGWFFRDDPGNAATPALRKKLHKDGTYEWQPMNGWYHTRGQPASRSLYSASIYMEDNAKAVFERRFMNA